MASGLREVAILGPCSLVAPAPRSLTYGHARPAYRLLLAVEGTLSLHKARRPRGKRTLYAEKAVPEYWVVDIDERSIERWRPDDSPVELLAESLQWQPDRDVPPLVVDLPSYFDRVHGLA